MHICVLKSSHSIRAIRTFRFCVFFSDFKRRTQLNSQQTAWWQIVSKSSKEASSCFKPLPGAVYFQTIHKRQFLADFKVPRLDRFWRFFYLLFNKQYIGQSVVMHSNVLLVIHLFIGQSVKGAKKGSLKKKKNLIIRFCFWGASASASKKSICQVLDLCF